MNNLSDPYIPTDEDLRERVESVCLPTATRNITTLHVATLPAPGSAVRPLCNRRSQASKRWKVRSPDVYPNYGWCKDCAFKLYNKRAPGNEEKLRMDGDAYE